MISASAVWLCEVFGAFEVAGTVAFVLVAGWTRKSDQTPVDSCCDDALAIVQRFDALNERLVAVTGVEARRRLVEEFVTTEYQRR